MYLTEKKQVRCLGIHFPRSNPKETRICFQDSINADVDTEIVIERLKSGDVPPGDFKFEDMRDPQAMLRPDAIGDNRATNLNLYPKKRELEKQVRPASNLPGTWHELA